jgi:hypothetical protein
VISNIWYFSGSHRGVDPGRFGRFAVLAAEVLTRPYGTRTSGTGIVRRIRSHSIMITGLESLTLAASGTILYIAIRLTASACSDGSEALDEDPEPEIHDDVAVSR